MLSIIIPAFNEENFLPLVLKQIRRQTFRDFEIIVADAGSQDRTAEIARSFGCRLTRGGSAAQGRNQGAKIARGDLLLFLDADNIYLAENFLERMILEFQEKKLDVAAFPLFVNGNFFDFLCYDAYNRMAKVTQNFLPHASNLILIKKDVFEKIGGFDEEIEIGEDHWLVRTAAKQGKFGFLNTPLVVTSARRQERIGRAKLYSLYLFTAFYMLFFGPLKKNAFAFYWLEK